MSKPGKPSYNVLLPKTSFPMKADLPKREPGFLSEWEKQSLYEKMIEKNKGKTRFVLHDGPPYANGHLHMGHALNKTLKDIIVKFQAMTGHEAPYVPGWDCHGLPIEHQLMKEKGWDKRKIGRVPFRQEAARYAEHFVNVQRQEFKRLGILGEWDRPYKTLSPDYEAGIARTFYDLLNKNFIYRDKKPVYWCGSCETALADAEVEYEDKASPSIYVKFPIQEWPTNPEAQEIAKKVGKRRAYVMVWTTTPWTLPANVALAFHPEQTYRIWDSPQNQEKYLVGAPGWKMLEEEFGPGDTQAPSIEGLSLEGLLAKNPLNNNDSQGILAEFVSSEDGTGVVHIAPGHGLEDYSAGRAYGLPTLSPVDEGGRFSSDVLPNTLAGQKIWDANEVIIDLLTKSRLLHKQKKITHSYPHCWRCKNPVFFRAADQWFLRVDDAFRQKLLDSVDTVTWIPDYGKERILGMLKSRPDWCLSRQRYWGTPIPMFHCEGCREPLRDAAAQNHVVGLFRHHGSNLWYEKEAKDLLPAGAKCGKCGKSGFRKEEDILDVWFDSGVSWVPVLRERLQVTDRTNVMYLEGSDQHRGWFQTSLLPAVALTGEPPFQKVLTHGFVVDGEGRKMSKSMGNVIAPQEVLEKYGADLLRLWVAMSDYREDVRLSQQILDQVVETYRKIRNTLRFLLGNLADFSPQVAVPWDELQDIDRSALEFLAQTAHDVRRHYEANEFHLVCNSLCGSLCINVLSGHYLDVQKDILYCDPADSPRRRSAQTAFLAITKRLATMMAPILSFTAEEVWQALAEQKLLLPEEEAKSVFLNAYPEKAALPAAGASGLAMEELVAAKQTINEAIEKVRQAGLLKGANDAHVTYRAPADALAKLEKFKKDFAWYMGVSKISLGAGDGGPTVEVVKAPGAKCDRCWIWREDVGSDQELPALCARCAGAEKAVRTAAPQKA